MPVTVAVAVVAHPARVDQADDLAAAVAAEITIIDRDGHGERWCHQRALEWLWLCTRADWLVWLEDDAIPHPQLRELLPGVLDDVDPGSLVSLYLGTGRWAGVRDDGRGEAHVRRLIELADTLGEHWIPAGRLWHAVAVAVHRDHAGRLLRHLRRDVRATDRAAGGWAEQSLIPVLYCHPSLVDHRDGPRLVPGDVSDVPRHAWRRGW